MRHLPHLANPHRTTWLQAFFWLLFVVFLAGESSAAKIDFRKEIAPILEERCWGCHGEDEQESALRLDLRNHMLKGGDSGLPAVVPGKPQKSYLIEVVKHLDPDVKMPPDEEMLPKADIDRLTRWIAEGAVWPGQMQAAKKVQSDHWAFQPVERPRVPKTNDSNRQPVDAFLLDALHSKGLTFSRQAEPGTLIGRASIVLTGLIPTPDESAKFLAAWEKNSDSAYEQLIDRLMASPHFGERWAQHWLDVIRWAETNGSESNLYRKKAWIYRDYVVRAFNEDKPYDRFVQEQIAGDSMGSGEATGFLVAGPHVPAATVGREPAAIRQARADRMDEIMQTVGASIMGVTLGCARCHNHKFDEITIKDYYALTAVFQDVEFGSRRPEYGEDHPLRKRGAELRKKIAAARAKLREFGGWEENWGAYRELHFPPVKTRAIRIQFKTINVTLDELQVLSADTKGINVAHQRRGTKVSGFPAEGIERRNPIRRLNDGQFGTMTWRARVPKDAKEKPWAQFDFAEAERIDRIRLSSNREYFYETDYLTKKPYLPRYEFDLQILKADGTWQPWVGTWFVNKKLAQEHPKRRAVLVDVQDLIETLAEEGPQPSFVGRFIEPAPARILLRGSPENPRDEVVGAAPEVFSGNLNLKLDSPGPDRRASFAKWVTGSKNPLTARVIVNRIWHHVFGRGIVSTTGDFGTAGAAPTHPELLDWMASEFVSPTSKNAKPWSMKSLIRMLVMSDAFRQASTPNREGIAKDASSELLWRFPPKRVEAEVIRDSILLASGLLNRKIGGRSFRIHNVKKTYAQWEVVNNYGKDTWRRMLYQERMRRVDDKMFTAFDFPDCGQVRAKRPVSTTPLQALNLMNSPFVMEQAKRIAERAEEDAAGNEQQAVMRCFDLLVGRVPNADEQATCVELAKESGLAIVCRALINSNEFAFCP